MEAAGKPGWKREAEEGVVFETVFDKWTLLAQVAWQIVVYNPPLPRKLQRTQDLLSCLTPEEKKMFKITEEDEEKLEASLRLISYYDRVLSFPNAFTGETFLTSKVLTEEEKRECLTKPERDSFWVNWDRRQLTSEGKTQLIEKAIKEKGFMVYGVLVDPRHVYCRAKGFEPKSDGWERQDDNHKSFQHYGKGKKLDFGKDDPLIWRVNFYVENGSLASGVKRAFRDEALEARKLIGSILQRMMKSFEGKTVYVIPEERKIP